MKRPGIIAALAVAVLLVAGIAYASIPGPDGMIHACYKTSNPAQGAVIAIDSAVSCPSGYASLNWQNGMTFYQVRTQVSAATDSTGASGASAICNGGDSVTGGGYALAPDITKVVASQPVPGNPQAWAVSFESTVLNGQVTITMFAICAHTGI